jgi:hypothetical protein
MFGCCCRQLSAMFLHGIPHVFARVWRRKSVWSAHQVGHADDQVKVFLSNPSSWQLCRNVLRSGTGHSLELRCCGLEQHM